MMLVVPKQLLKNPLGSTFPRTQYPLYIMILAFTTEKNLNLINKGYNEYIFMRRDFLLF